MNRIFLKTDRVLLKEIYAEEWRYFVELDSDPEVMRYLSDGKATTEEEAKSTMERIQKTITATNYKFGLWWAFERSTDEFIGWFLFRPGRRSPDNFQDIELGYRLKRKFWGRGFATEVSRSLIERGFSDYDLESIFATTMKKNLASQAVMKKLGMDFVSDYLEELFPGEDKEAVIYRIARKNWRK